MPGLSALLPALWLLAAPADIATTSTLSPAADRNSRIIGGERARLGQFPHQARVLSDDMEICGGSLIAATRVLTAAHCVLGYKEYHIRLGGVYREWYEETAWAALSRLAEVHPRYNTLVYHNHDVAVVFLQEPAPLNSYIKLVALPSTLEVNNSFMGEKALISGWGQTSGASIISSHLRWTTVTVVSNPKCEQFHKPGYIVESTLCAINTYVGICFGDSGSPLVLETGRGYKQIGVASFVDSPGCDEVKPGAYVRVTSVLDWITRNVNDSVL